MTTTMLVYPTAKSSQRVLTTQRNEKLSLLCLIFIGRAIKVSAAWKAAPSKAIITPDKQLWMVCYSSRKTGAQGKLQGLFAKALVLEDESRARRAIITLDLNGAPKSLQMAVECAAPLVALKSTVVFLLRPLRPV